MSEFNKGTVKEFIAPDYSEAGKEDPESDEESITYIDEAKEDEIIDNKVSNNDNKMAVTTPFGTTPQQSTTTTPTWGSSSNTTPFSQPTWGVAQSQQSTSSFWSQPQQQSQPKWGAPSWGNNSSTTQSGGLNGKIEIDRTKRVIITDFLDIIVETFQSNGVPGLIPRGIYDLKPRFDVWSKLNAFNPEKIYILSTLTPDAMSSESWNVTYAYYCQCLSSFLRLQHYSCQVVMQGYGTSKAYVISSLLCSIGGNIEAKDAVYIGLNSGMCGQSNQDKLAAEISGIDYIDLNQLLNNMY